MADQGVNGWYYGGMSDYYGKNLALPVCKGCHYLQKTKGSIGTFGDYIFKCTAGTSCAASQMGQGKMVSDCDEFEPAESSSKKDSGKSGKRPIWLRIICCPLCCIWHTLGNQLNFERGCKKAYTW